VKLPCVSEKLDPDIPQQLHCNNIFGRTYYMHACMHKHTILMAIFPYKPGLVSWHLDNWSVACINWVTCKKWIWENRHWSCRHANG